MSPAASTTIPCELRVPCPSAPATAYHVTWPVAMSIRYSVRAGGGKAVSQTLPSAATATSWFR